MHKTFFDLAPTKFLAPLVTPYDPIMLHNLQCPLTHCGLAHAAPSKLSFLILFNCCSLFNTKLWRHHLDSNNNNNNEKQLLSAYYVLGTLYSHVILSRLRGLYRSRFMNEGTKAQRGCLP